MGIFDPENEQKRSKDERYLEGGGLLKLFHNDGKTISGNRIADQTVGGKL